MAQSTHQLPRLPLKDYWNKVTYPRDTILPNLKKAILIDRIPFAGATRMNCTINAQQAAEQFGGSVVFGWDITSLGDVLEAECHVIHRTVAGDLVDVTPSQFGFNRTCFVPFDGVWTDLPNSVFIVKPDRLAVLNGYLLYEMAAKYVITCIKRKSEDINKVSFKRDVVRATIQQVAPDLTCERVEEHIWKLLNVGVSSGLI